MYSVKGIRNQKFKRKLIATSFALVLLAEFGEFFVPKNDVDCNWSHIEVPEHMPDGGRNDQVQKKPKPPTHYLHSKQA